LARQARLLEHLTSSAGIFGAARGISNDPVLHGLDLGLLHLEARFSHEKRMQKIEWVLTETFALLGASRAAIVREFVEACPPTGITWLENARQFHDFLKARWRRENPDPPYLPDVAAYEMASARVRAGERRVPPPAESHAAPGAIRLHPRAVMLRCAYDIRPILEQRDGDGAPQQRETLLAITWPPDADEPWVMELSPELFQFLEMLDDYADPVLFAAVADVADLVADLSARGLIEVQP
jgi:hypothetical protein